MKRKPPGVMDARLGGGMQAFAAGDHRIAAGAFVNP